jgi:hypothetical protein
LKRKLSVSPVRRNVAEPAAPPSSARTIKTPTDISSIIDTRVKGKIIAVPEEIQMQEAPTTTKPQQFSITTATMSQLIRHKFPEGKLSSKEIARREKIQQQRSGRKGADPEKVTVAKVEEKVQR